MNKRSGDQYLQETNQTVTTWKWVRLEIIKWHKAMGLTSAFRANLSLGYFWKYMNV